MSFILETTDMDLGDTPIENIFINDYMPMADGTSVKVYLLGYKYAHDRDINIEVNNRTIAKHLEIPMEDVLRAWDFWESKGIIEKVYIDTEESYNYTVRFFSLKQLYIKNNRSLFMEDKREKKKENKQRVTEKDVFDANQMPIINKMFNNIDDIIRRQTVPLEKQKILSWMQDFNMNPDVIEEAFRFSVEKKGVRNINYVEGIIRNWYDEGLTNMEALVESFKEKDDRYYKYHKILQALGMSGQMVTDGQRKIIDPWFDKYNYTLEMVLKACENSANTSNPSVKYIDGIIKSWDKKGIRVFEDIEILDIKEERPKYERKSQETRPSVKTKFHNFDQVTEKFSNEELETASKRKMLENIKRLKGEA